MLEVLEIDRHLLIVLSLTSWPHLKTFKESEQSLRVVWHAGKLVLSLTWKNFDLLASWSKCRRGRKGLTLWAIRIRRAEQSSKDYLSLFFLL